METPCLLRRNLAGRALLALALPCFSLKRAEALTASLLNSQGGQLGGNASDRFRAWMGFIVAEQLRRGPSPRWQHRDCAGFVRFAVAESFRLHDFRWRKANALEGVSLPPEVGTEPAGWNNTWLGLSSEKSAFVSAAAIIQKNSIFEGRDTTVAKMGDLLFFDQGDDQHLMIWMGTWIAYHTGQTPITPADKTTMNDNGLRAVRPAKLLEWKDTRWRPTENNPNFIGVFRLAFLAR